MSSARKAPQSMAVRMKPLPRATITSISGSSLPGVVSSVWKRSAGTNAELPSLIWRRRAMVGKKVKATAGAWRAGQARKACTAMSRATKIRIGASTARGISSTMKET